MSHYHVLDRLDWFEAHEDTASQWTEDARCRFSPTDTFSTPVELRPCAEPKQLFLVCTEVCPTVWWDCLRRLGGSCGFYCGGEWQCVRKQQVAIHLVKFWFHANLYSLWINHVKSEDTKITWLATLVSEISSYSWDNSVILSEWLQFVNLTHYETATSWANTCSYQ